ncbi:MAG: sigma-54 dependent transcriptional regulator [Gemmatimonadota bacterium]|nr:sigma-54 dependent transcriptional regulator [Gemmatimonadota bacterium]MDH3368504.1 sigma-54 dependent transcriptional regulator [Gemmatimonadota bacterium]MDH3478150.1 sigma-54 dependent transcriptional regulator [Gemmatimonadota bacterium]MDH3570313.1 sigma-54 dependent transcriptional regulator [Gemmatimonadota bacterium]
MTARPVLAVVDDDELTRTWLTEHLGAAGYTVHGAATGQEALALVERVAPALMLLDLRLPDGDGLKLLERFRELDQELVVIIVTAYGEIETAVQAVKTGAYHFLQKPPDLDDLLITIDKGLEARRLRQRVTALEEQHSWQFADVQVVGRSVVLRGLVEAVGKVARAGRSTVLLRGESGTGKDLLARAIHAQSDRRDQPFLQINCTALPEHLVESELFGHERGAFTDARERKKGLAELADGGTLLLDEIGDMPLAAQAKLLQFLEDSRFKRVGGTSDVTVDVRVIAATNRALETAMAEGTFRSDLFYRLNVVPITIPPLRDHPEDVAPLAEHFARQLARDLKRDPPRLTPDAMRVLEGYAWPGNVRELRNVLERALILEETLEIRPEHLPAELSAHGTATDDAAAFVTLPPEGVELTNLELGLIRQALARTDGNVTQAAKLLGLTRDTLRYRMEKHGL